MSSKSPKPTDVYVGQRLRSLRLSRGMSQATLGQHMGLTFQQVQKYEKGSNRMGASRLQQAADILGVSPTHFFEGAPSSTGNIVEHVPVVDHLLDLGQSRSGQELAKAFLGIANDELRLAVLHTAQAAARATNPNYKED